MKKKEHLLIIPGVLGLLIFYIIPFVYSLYYSTINNVFRKQFVWLDNYKMVLQNKYYLLALKNTVEFTAISVPIVTLLAFIIAIFLRTQDKRLTWIRSAFVLPVLMPSASVVIIMSTLFGDGSVFVRILESVVPHFAETQRFRISIYAFFIWKNVGLSTVLFMASMAQIPREVNEAAMIDGANLWRRSVHITFPILLPTTFFVIVYSVLQSLRVFKETWLMYGSYPDRSIYFVQTYMNNHFYKLNYQFLATGAVIVAIVVYLFVLGAYRLENRLTKGIW